MESLIQDARYSLRRLRNAPGFVVVAVLSLALGVGVNTAVFSVLNTLLLRPLPVRDLDRAVIVFDASPGNPDRGTSFQGFLRYRDRTETFSSAMAFSGARPLSLIDGDRRETVHAEVVTADFFSMAAVHLGAGRPFDRAVDRASDPQFVVVLSHAFWQRRLASDPAVVGKTLVLNGRPFTAIGVAGAGFAGFDREVSADLWMPLTTWAHLMEEPGRLTGEEHWLTTIAQLKPGVTVQQAQAAMDAAGRSMPRPAGEQTRVRPARQTLLAESATDALILGAGALGVGLLVLLLACTNVANLLMARAAARQREMSVRMALGASRARLIRLWLIESVLLCLLAGAIALPLASWFVDAGAAFKPPALIGQVEAPALAAGFQLDVRVFAFTLGLSLFAALLVGLVAAIQGSKPRAMQGMRADRATDRRFAPGFNARSAVIALQMALSLFLLVPCGLFVRSWLNASAMSPGFSVDRVLLLPISTEQSGVRITKPPGFDQQLAGRVAGLPGVEAATVMDPVPLWFGGNFASFLIGDGAAPGTPHRTGFALVAPGYFDTLRIPLLRGRDFAASDNASAPQVAIVNETMARRFWPGGDALGQRIRNREADIEIVGIARDAKYLTLAETSRPWVYRPLAQNATNNPALSLAARTTGDPLRLRTAIEREVRALVPSWPAFQFRTLDEGLQLQRLLPRAGATLLGVLGLFGLLLASIGVYGVMACVVRQRTHEIGIRLALGAPAAALLVLVIRQGMSVCLVGAAIGLAMSVGASRLLASVLYGISAVDPITYVAVPTLLISVALLACYVPARRATRVNALEALRSDGQ